MLNFLLVGLGGGVGAIARYGVSLAIPAQPTGWPWATFLINVTGSLLMGVVAGWVGAKGEAGEPWRLLLGVGVLGGYTTFSAYSLETLRLIERNDMAGAAAYSLGSVIAGLAAVAIGVAIAKRVIA
ncbi:MAG TPA: fluoride efflux transporter CrcB [Hyphomonadaceae bacterium]|jgi:CrcB protein|nr:fluoride efflux transporter CrcB [Hyphomonadaceae bacterium]